MISPRYHLGILQQSAPSLGVKEWFQLPEGKRSLDVSDFKGKVLYLYCFQSWCEGCHLYGFPALLEVMKHFSSEPRVGFVTVQTTFEGFDANRFEDAKKVATRYELKIPLGQSGSEREPSALMARYRTGGTPWIVLIDPQGVVRYNDFHIRPQEAIQLIEGMFEGKN